MAMINSKPLALRSGRDRRSTPSRTYFWFKKGLDLTAAVVGLATCLPLLVMSMLWIRMVDGGPVLYSQWRVGRDGWLFRVYKLRTMTSEAEPNGTARFASCDDPRILPGCGWMRKSHVDELPQLWNILRGQMSLVGPRPERPEIIDKLRRSMPGFDRRLIDKPGLTGLAQVRNGYTYNLAGARKKLAYDLRYLRQRSVLREVQLVFATIPKMWDQSAL